MDAWFSHDGFVRLVKEEWRKIGEVTLIEKFKALRNMLRQWNNEEFGNIDGKINLLEKELTDIDKVAESGSLDETKEARGKALWCLLEKWYNRRDNYWKQLSRSKYAKNMDRNSRYFHTVASSKGRRKTTQKLRINGEDVLCPRRIKKGIRLYLKKLYKQNHTPEVKFQDGLVWRISREEAMWLESAPSKEEIKSAVWGCDPMKAPSVDGFNFELYKKIVG